MKSASLDDFKKSITAASPAEHLSIYLRALWWSGKGDWNRAHELIQDVNDRQASHIHAYLHRLEGDADNARYWYSKAGQIMPRTEFYQEWENLVLTFL
jgi:hypothetical protein